MLPLERADPIRIGPYRLLARLGEGGMGTVFLAESDGGRRVALKAIRRGFAHEPGFRARFVREIETASMVRSPFIARVVDAEPGDGGAQPWVATEYVPGPSLQQLVSEQGPLPLRSAGALALGLARALRTVHEAGLVHRDVKPSNLLITVEGPRLIDFGVARLVDAASTGGLTRTGSSVGSPGYMSPEQVLGNELSPLSDVFGLGGVLVFATTGRLPFPVADSANQHALMFAVVQAEPTLEGVPPELRETVVDCLGKDPATRPAAAALAERLGGHAAALDGEEDGGDAEPWLPARALAQVARISGRALAQGEWRPSGDAEAAYSPTVTAGPGAAPAAPAAPVPPPPAHSPTTLTASGPAAAPGPAGDGGTPPPAVPAQSRQPHPASGPPAADPGPDAGPRRYVRAEPVPGTHPYTRPPSGAPGYHGASSWPQPPGHGPRSLTGLATALYWLFGIYLAFKLVSIAMYASFADTVGTWKADDWALWVDVDREVGDLDALLSLELLYLTAVSVVWLVWFWRVRYNAGLFAPHEHRHSSAMAVGGWFIPFGFWVIPARIARDAWYASLPERSRGRPGERSTTPGLPWPGRALLGWWWAASIAASIAAFALVLVVAGIGDAPDRDAGVIDFERMSSLAAFGNLLHVLCMPMAVLSIVVVRRLTELQEYRAYHL